MNNILKRMREPSTWAGVGLLLQGLAQIVASQGQDATAWATMGAGLVAIARPEGA